MLKYYFLYSLLILLAYLIMNYSSLDITKLKNAIFGILYSRYYIDPHCDVFMFIGNAPLWFLTTYIVTIILFNIIPKFKKNIFNIIAIIIPIIIAYFLLQSQVLLPWGIDISFLMVSFMLIGKLIKDNNLLDKINNIYIVILYFIGLLFLSQLNGNINISLGIYGDNIILYVLNAILGSICTIYLSKKLEKTFISDSLVYIGKNTLTIMAIHLMGLFCFDKAFSLITDVSNLNGLFLYFYTSLKVILVVIACPVIISILKRVKYLIVVVFLIVSAVTYINITCNVKKVKVSKNINFYGDSLVENYDLKKVL